MHPQRRPQNRQQRCRYICGEPFAPCVSYCCFTESDLSVTRKSAFAVFLHGNNGCSFYVHFVSSLIFRFKTYYCSFSCSMPAFWRINSSLYHFSCCFSFGRKLSTVCSARCESASKRRRLSRGASGKVSIMPKFAFIGWKLLPLYSLI